MAANIRSSVVLGIVFVLGAIGLAEAQSPGVRSNGMAGAFTAVADDASATYWNPAGLATGSFVSFVIEYTNFEISEQPLTDVISQSAPILAFSLPPVGFAYYKVGVFGQPVEPAVHGPPNRQEVGRTALAVSSSNVGVSLLHSLTEHIVIGATPRVVHAGLSTRADVDAGVMVAVSRFRAGFAARNLVNPTFELDVPAGTGVEMRRQARLGAAWGSGWPGLSRVVVAVDSDLTRTLWPTGDRRDVSAGIETWWSAQRRLGIRGGVRASTIGDSRAVVTAGVSAGLTAALFVDGFVAQGEADDRAWGVGARFVF